MVVDIRIVYCHISRKKVDDEEKWKIQREYLGSTTTNNGAHQPIKKAAL
jgi:hypothetical protein